jgi:hypothetical protein
MAAGQSGLRAIKPNTYQDVPRKTRHKLKSFGHRSFLGVK